MSDSRSFFFHFRGIYNKKQTTMLEDLYDGHGYMSVDGMQTLAQQGILGFDPTLEKDIELVEAMSYFTEGGVTDTDLRPAKCACGG